MTPIEYECERPVTIRRCPEGCFAGRCKPAYWYLCRPMFTMDAPQIGWTREEIKSWKDQGFNTAYWDGENWAPSHPKQFATAEEAFEEWEKRVRLLGQPDTVSNKSEQP
jgi:hypothetical protein